MIPLSLTKNIPWKWVGVAVVVIGTGVYVYNLKLDIASLETTVAEQQTTIERKNTEITGLKASVSKQNDEVDRWRRVASERQQQVTSTLKEAERQSARANRMIDRLQSSEAQTCEEGIELIDEALGL